VLNPHLENKFSHGESPVNGGVTLAAIYLQNRCDEVKSVAIGKSSTHYPSKCPRQTKITKLMQTEPFCSWVV